MADIPYSEIREAESSFTVIQRWSDPPEEGRSADEWPYPTEHVVSAIGGELANRIRAALDAPQDAQVVIEETIVSGGWSEYTQENDHEYEVRCGNNSWTSTGYSYGNHIGKLLQWLNESEGK